MSEQSNEAMLRRYLLADLNEAEREKIEERLFSDDRFAEELVRAETGLVDDYALRALSQSDRDLFEQNFILTGERRKNLVFAQAVNAYLEDEASVPAEPAPRSWWTRFLLFVTAHKGWTTVAATAAILLVVLLPAIFKWFGPNDQLALMQADRERMRRTLDELNRRPASVETQPAIERSLQPGNLRRGDGEMAQIEVGKDVHVLNLSLVLPDPPHSKYSVIAKTVEGDELFTLGDLSPEANGPARISLRIPTEFLPTNDYQFELKGIAADGNSTGVALYNLRVINSAARR